MPLPDYSEQVIQTIKSAEGCISLSALIFWFSDILEDKKPTLLCNIMTP